MQLSENDPLQLFWVKTRFDRQRYFSINGSFRAKPVQLPAERKLPIVTAIKRYVQMNVLYGVLRYSFVGPGLHVRRLYSRTSFIYKYETSTLTPLV